MARNRKGLDCGAGGAAARAANKDHVVKRAGSQKLLSATSGNNHSVK